MIKVTSNIDKKILLKAYKLMAMSKNITDIYDKNVKEVAKYVHATSRGHEAIQLAVGLQLLPQDFVSPYYRDESMLLGIGMRPYDLMLQLFAKKDDPFSGGRLYYAHASLKDDDKPKIIHQSSATGMQAIPTTGVAMGIQYKEKEGLAIDYKGVNPVTVCSFGDACITEGEVSEAFQMAALKQLPILFLVQDNDWDISAKGHEIRAQNAYEYVQGFKGIEAITIDGTDFIECFNTIQKVYETIRKERRPFLVHANVPLLNHHTSGVRMEWYRDDLEESFARDPFAKFKNQLLELGIAKSTLTKLEKEAKKIVETDFQNAKNAEDPSPSDLFTNTFAPTPITEEKGIRAPEGREDVVFVDCGLFAVEEILREHPEALLYGQDVGARLGGVFREAATLAHKFGDNRVFNTPIQEAFIIGSTVGMSAAGLKPIVEVQFADYIWPGLNQLFSEVSRSYYLTNGKWPVSMVLRVPIGAYGKGGPYHSSSIESVLTNINGIKIVYPSTGADLKGLLKAAYYDPNPVVVLEHKGLYWSKVPGTNAAKTPEPSKDYVIPLGKARIALDADENKINSGESMVVVTYGMGVHWALNAAKSYKGQIEILDLRTLSPLDTDAIFDAVKKHNKCLVITEEPVNNTFAQSIAARIQENCFEYLDGPVRVLGAENMPAIPLNVTLEAAMMPNSVKVGVVIGEILTW